MDGSYKKDLPIDSDRKETVKKKPSMDNSQSLTAAIERNPARAAVTPSKSGTLLSCLLSFTGIGNGVPDPWQPQVRD